MKVCWTFALKSLRVPALAAALLAGATSGAVAHDYNGGNGGSHHYHPKPQPTKTVRASSSGSSGKRHTYSARYRTGGSGYGWLNQWSRGSRDNYSTRTSISTPHRGDWNAKLKAQRKWDEQEYKKMQQADASGARCGLSNAPAYCYRLQGPYPKEMYVVRY